MKFEAEGREFSNILRSLEQFFLTVGQNNFGNKIPFNWLTKKLQYGLEKKKQEPNIEIVFGSFQTPCSLGRSTLKCSWWSHLSISIHFSLCASVESEIGIMNSNLTSRMPRHYGFMFCILFKNSSNKYIPLICTFLNLLDFLLCSTVI